MYLQGEKLLQDGQLLRLWRWLGSLILATGVVFSVFMISNGQKGLYMGLILGWALPFALVLWYAFENYFSTRD